MLQISQLRAQRLPAQLCKQPAQATASPSDTSFLFFVLRSPGICAIEGKRTGPLAISATDKPLSEGSIGHRTTLPKKPGRPWRDLLELPTLGQHDLLPRPRSPCLVPSVSTLRTTSGAPDLFIFSCTSLQTANIWVSVQAPISGSTLKVGQTAVSFLLKGSIPDPGSIIRRLSDPNTIHRRPCDSTAVLTPSAAVRVPLARRIRVFFGLPLPCHRT